MAPRTRSSTSSLNNFPTSTEDEIGSSTKRMPPHRTFGKSCNSYRKSCTASPLTTSSVPTPTFSYSSESEQATPSTSSAATPAALDSKTKPSSSSAPTRTGSRIEVHLTNSKPPADSYRVLQQSVYSMNSKRKRADDSEDEEDEEADFRPKTKLSTDAQLARRLQEEEYNLADVSTSSAGPTYPRSFYAFPIKSCNPHRVRAYKDKIKIKDEDEDEDEDEDDIIQRALAPTSKAKGKQLAPSSRARPTTKLISLISSDDEDEKDDVEITEQDDDDEPLKQVPSTRSRRPNPNTTVHGGSASDESSYLDSDDIYSEEEDEVEADEDENGDGGASTTTARGRAVPSHGAPTILRYRPVVVPRRRGLGKRSKLPDLLDVHPEMRSMWTDLERMPILKAAKAEQPKNISRQLKPFQLEGLSWMREMEKTKWKGGLLGDEMGLGKTIQAVSLIMSDWPAKKPSLVLVPPVAMMQWTAEINSYTNGALNTLFFHGTNAKAKNLTVKDLKKYHVVVMSYNSLESMFRKQEKGFKRKDGLYKEKSIIHQTQFHRIILDEAHSIKTRATMTAKACFALKTTYRWCLSGTPLQNRIGELFSLVRFLNIQPFAYYVCKSCPCSTLEWSVDEDNYCTKCKHTGMQHVSIFNRELLNPIQKYGARGPGAEALGKLRILTDRLMLRRLKKDHTDSMELPVKEIYVERQFFGEEENDFANSIMTNGQRRFDTYVAQGVLLNNYANIFGLIMQMRQVADHPDLILRKNNAGGQNVLVCCICDEPAEEAIRSKCRHDFCRSCAKSYLASSTQPDCPQCHIGLSIDLEQPEIEQDEDLVKKSSIINRIKMENWTSSSKIELLVHELHKLRSDNASHKSIIFSQFTTMLQLIEWRLRRAGITTVMLDGSMSPAQRQASIDYFMGHVEVECFLVSLKAGGVALNLTEASRVFIIDPWWNPAAEWQSADRCHRIGQTRPCTITRLCIEDSVESRMVLLQEKKTNMINSTINSDDAAMDSLTPEDLQFLFRGN